MKILITGASGLVGSQVVEILRKNAHNSLLTPSSSELDVSIHEAVIKYVSDQRPEIIIHFAAYTDVTSAEKERNNTRGKAWMLNVEATRSIAEAAHQHKIFLIHISTDMVFSGSSSDRGPYSEDHPVEADAQNLPWYGWTKAAAEQVVTMSPAQSAIVRISNPVGKNAEPKPDYVHKLLNAYEQKKLLKLFSDQYLSLSWVNDLASALEVIITRRETGIFHVSSKNIFTPFELGEFILNKKYGVSNVVQRSSIEDFLKTPGNATRYPHYGGLDVTKTQQRLGLSFHTWQEITEQIVT